MNDQIDLQWAVLIVSARHFLDRIVLSFLPFSFQFIPALYRESGANPDVSF
jgi:hypothetical protein